MTYTVLIERDTQDGIIREPVSGVTEEMIQSVKDAARFNSQAGDTVTFQVITER